MDDLDEDLQATKFTVHRVQSQQTDDCYMLRDMQHHLEDLDNRNRRNNIRVRGLPESSRPEDLRSVLQTIFNNLLGVPASTHIEMDRAHRALKPKDQASKPRDVICRVHLFALKEDIMRKARLIKLIVDGAPIQLFPDLSWITLQKRRLLQPLLHSLQDNSIAYRWGFLFSLTATHAGKTATLQVPEDICFFCETPHSRPPRLGYHPPSSPIDRLAKGPCEEERTSP